MIILPSSVRFGYGSYSKELGVFSGAVWYSLE